MAKTPSKKAKPTKKAAKKVAAKKTVKKAVAKKAVKVATKKTAAKKAAKKASTKKVAAKKAVAKKAPGEKKAVKAKKTTAKKAKAAPEKPVVSAENEEMLKDAVRKLKGDTRHTPAIFKVPDRKHTPVVFSLDEVRSYLSNRKETAEAEPEKEAKPKAAKKVAKPAPEAPVQPRNRRLGAASVADILGFAPGKTGPGGEIPRKYRKYYNALVELQDHVRDGISEHAKSTRKTDDLDRSEYGKDLADAGMDNFDKDFALSLISNEQELLHEIDEAIRRIRNGTYGICEVTGKPIAAERLEAVPFTRYSLEGQATFEQTNRRASNRGGVAFADADDERPAMTEEDSDS